MKKRILHISKYYYPFAGGTEQIARDCVLALKENYDQIVIGFNDRNCDSKEEIDGVTVYKCKTDLKISSQPLSSSYHKILKKIINDFSPDIIIFHYPNPFAAYLLLKEIRYKKAKLIVYWHLDIIKQKVIKVFFNRQNRNLLNLASRVVATSPNYVKGSKWLRTIEAKCIIIPNCINVERLKTDSNILSRAEEIRKDNKEKIICLGIGRHTKYKGFEYLIKASRYLDEKYKIYLIGTGELTAKLKDEARDDKKIIFCGKVSDDNLKALLLAADIFCFPSITKNEAFGVALAEAMYYKKPVITFNIPGSGVNYVNLKDITGLEVENKNYKQFARAIKQLGDDKEARQHYGEEGKKRVEKYFLSTKFKKNINNLILDVLDNEI